MFHLKDWLFQASKDKQRLRQGISDVQKALRRNETGVVVLAGKIF